MAIKRVKHGMSKTRFYTIWKAMRHRCTIKSSPHYKNYGGRGITYDKRWDNFLNFKEDMYESYLEHVKKFGEKDTTFDRIDSDGNYYKENCRWATWEEQSNNKRNTIYVEYRGNIYSLKALTDELNKDYELVRRRIQNLNWEVEEAIHVPVNTRGNKIYTFDGISHSMQDWLRIMHIGKNTLESRINRGWSMKLILTTPSDKWE